MTTYNKTIINGSTYEIRTNVGAFPRCWKDGEEISHDQYMTEVYDYLAKKYANINYNKLTDKEST